MSRQPSHPPARVYRRTPQGELRLWVVDPITDPAGPDAPRPAVVWFHGGGWNHGSPTQFQDYAQALAEVGWASVLVEYRLAQTHHTGPIDAAADAVAAMVYLRRHAADLGIDPRRLVAAGGSAGGQLAAFCATMSRRNPLGLHDAELADARPDGLVLFNPVFDNSPEGYGAERFAGRWRDFSPLHNLHDRVPPSLVMLGDADVYLPVATAQAWQKQSTQLGVRSDLEVYAGQKHGFYLPDYHAGSPEMFDRTLDRVRRFLHEIPAAAPSGPSLPLSSDQP